MRGGKPLSNLKGQLKCYNTEHKKLKFYNTEHKLHMKNHPELLQKTQNDNPETNTGKIVNNI